MFKKKDKKEIIENEESSIIFESPNNKNNTKKKSYKFLIYFSLVIVLTGLSLFFSLYQNFDSISAALRNANWKYLLIILSVVVFSFVIDGAIILIFCRLYTRKYHLHQGLATSMVGAFYSAVTPGASGGQIMQVYTMKKQGVETSNGASIMIMAFIVYQLALVTIGIIAVFFKWNLITSIGQFSFEFGSISLPVPAILLTIIGFIINLSVIGLLFLMSYSKWIHNIILNNGIGLFAKLKIIKKPDEMRDTLRIQVENFKIELRRLLSNIPVFILIYICFMLLLVCRFSIPYIAGLALDGYGYLVNNDGSLIVFEGMTVLSTGQVSIQSFWDSVFLSSYHQMITGLIPLPGSAGISEYMFNIIFAQYYVSAPITTAAQILWRMSTFYIVLLVSGIVSATYRGAPKNKEQFANRKTFVTMQYETYEYRKASSDTLYETSSLSSNEIKKRLKTFGAYDSEEIALNKKHDDLKQNIIKQTKKSDKVKKIKEQKVKKVKPKKVKQKKEIIDSEWTVINTGDE